MKTIQFNIPAIHCNHCVHTIEMELKEVDGVKSVKADLNTKSVKVSYDAPADLKTMVTLLREINYPPME
jgi:copper chaperone